MQHCLTFEYGQEAYIIRPAVFLDRDGVINEIVYNDDTEQMDSPFSVEDFNLICGVKNAIELIKQLDYYIFVVTNQPAAAKGKTTVEKIEMVNDYMQSVLGNTIDRVYCCFHYPKRTWLTVRDDLIFDCDCRKPKPGLLMKAAREFQIDMNKSYMVGDSYSDVLAGKNAGVKTVFIGNYKCDVCRMLGNNKPDIVAESLKEFAYMLKKEKGG